jgi:asparagine synthase (glutamine-hydrolysing)
MIAPYGPDAEGSFNSPSSAIVFRAFHTTAESESEVQPYVSPSDVVITWDGRLDNREDLIRSLGGELSSSATDLGVVAAGYERWGSDCLPKLIGDWALAVWNQRERSLTLARDFIGARHLYYRVQGGQVSWSTILDPLLLFAGNSLAIEEEYLAGWLAFFPAATLTPFTAIRAVPPAHFVVFQSGKTRTRKYWEFDPGKRVIYQRDEDYEDSFREKFALAVSRRLRSNRPVLAELSGGIDSSSIVCTADELIARSSAECSRLDTISYYDDSEPNWNERPYFTLIEEQRGRAGFHIDVNQVAPLQVSPEMAGFAATPAHIQLPTGSAEQLARCVSSNRNRVLLSGTGGDEVTGGVPSPFAELADLMRCGEWRRLAQQLESWSLEKRRPWLHLLGDTISRFLPGQRTSPPAPWLKWRFVARHGAAFRGYETRLKISGVLPSFQENLLSVEALRRQLACHALRIEPLLEKRLPYLDRDLLEFLFAIPREQLLRPGQRRSLVRRAMASRVPGEVLYRKRKAYVARVPKQLLQLCEQLLTSREWISSSHGIVDCVALRQAVQQIRLLQAFPVVALNRTLAAELWLRLVHCSVQIRTASTPFGLIPPERPRPVQAASHKPHFQLERR